MTAPALSAEARKRARILEQLIVGAKVVRARRSIGSCLLLDFEANEDARLIALVIESARWAISGLQGVKQIDDWSETTEIDSCIEQIKNTLVSSCLILDGCIEFIFNAKIRLNVTPTNDPSADPMDNWFFLLGDSEDAYLSVDGSGNICMN